jgi:hypothetical protein
MTQPDGGDIIIRGGSVDLEYDDSVYPKDAGDPKKHRNENRKIINILIEDENGRVKYDSGGENPMKWKVSVFAR